jgi:hypothetical protein
VTLDKGEQRSDWLRGPLTASQLDYARDDVVHLDALYRALADEAGRLGRRAWLDEDSARLAQARDENGERWPHLSLRSAQFLDTAAQHRLLRLLRWRDAYARTQRSPAHVDPRQRTGDGSSRAIRRSIATASSARWTRSPKSPSSLVDAIWTALTTPLPDEAEAPRRAGGRTRQGRAAQVAGHHGGSGARAGLAGWRAGVAALVGDAAGWPRLAGRAVGWRAQLLERGSSRCWRERRALNIRRGDQPALARQLVQLEIRLQPQLRVDVRAMRVRGLVADADGRRHARHRVPARQQQEHLRLAAREFRQQALLAPPTASAVQRTSCPRYTLAAADGADGIHQFIGAARLVT